ncbi:MAG TPA: hypothetical protein ENK04_14890 [Gammaproteobacteria bacterium]|nr:hypothetical protein [Gammaproteobacteria bacterium]
MSRNRLIILGSSVTALAVVRNAVANNLEPVLLDTRDGIAFRSSLAQNIFCDGSSDSEVLHTLLELGQSGICALIASSDRWIDFLVSNRSSLEQVYGAVLQASNDVLTICTDKLLFAHWCAENNVAAPRLYQFGEQDLPPDEALNYPLLLRPYKGVMNVEAGRVPKAVEVADRASLQRWLKTFRDAGVQPIITQSLLGLDLIQYSVGLARNGGQMVSFVAEKLRPVADQCAVGSYVVLRDNPAIEKLARDVASRIDYFGIAEFEILHARETGENYLIEINARPWIQYGLGLCSGHNLLQVLLDAPAYDASREKKSGIHWLDFNNDLFNCFSRSVGVVRKGEVSLFSYVVSLLRANAFAKWQMNDQQPFWQAVSQSISGIFPRGRR